MMGGWGKGWGKGKGGGGSNFTVKHPDSTVWLGGLAPGTTYQQVQEHMKQIGNCRRAEVKNNNTGFAWFSSEQEAQSAIKLLNGSTLNGASIVVDAWTKKETDGSGGPKVWKPQFQKNSWSDGGGWGGKGGMMSLPWGKGGDWGKGGGWGGKGKGGGKGG